MISITPKAVFFDWDGTLVDTIPGVLEAHNHVRNHYGLTPWDLEWYKQNMGRSALKTYPEIFGENSQTAIDMLYGYIEDNHLTKLTAMEGAADTLTQLKELSVPMAIVSNKRHKYLMREIVHMGWGDYFTAAIGAGVASKDKPDPEPLLMMMEKVGVKPQDIIYVGDNETDLMATGAAGCPVALILHGEKKDSLIEKYRPAIVADHFGNLQNQFSSLFSKQNLLRA